MRPLSPLRRRPLAPALLLGLGLTAAGLPARAEPPPPSPPPSWTPTVPVPPPEPPARPEELKPQAAESGRPVAPAPLPPERPPELSAAPKVEAPAGAPEGLPKPTVPGSADAPAQAEPPAPTHPLPAAPLPPARPPELGGAPAASPQPGAPPPGEAPQSAPPAPTHPLSPPPLPPARPPELGAAPFQPAVPSREVPLPPARPSELSDKPATGQEAPQTPPASAPLPPARPPELSPNAPAPGQAVPMPDDTACLRRLERLGVRFARQEPIVNGQCSVAAPVTVSGLGDGIALRSAETMVCPVAEALARWTFEVQVAAEKDLGDSLKGLSLGGGYACRGMNHGPDAQLSEHAFANAVDVMGFTFAKHAPIAVGFLPAGTPEAAFLASVRAKACGFFRTVLGPGANEAHANHLHFDERDRTRGLRLCE